MIVLTQEQAANLLWRDQFRHARLLGRRLNDGKYAYPESVLTDPAHARWHSLLRQGTITPAGSLTFTPVAEGQRFSVLVDGKEMYLQPGAEPTTYGFPVPDLFDMPAANLYRFEAHRNRDAVASGDYKNNRRRVELIKEHSTGYAAGETLWASWSLIMTDQREGFTTDNCTLIHQWHGSYSSAFLYPVFWVGLRDSTLEVCTRSSADGDKHTHYFEPFDPPSGQPNHFVVSGLLGESGHLNVWLNGEQVVDVDIPIGYYSEPYPLAYPQFGIYMNNAHSVDVLYHANVEYGLSDLSARITDPVTVPTPPEGWPVVEYFPSDDLFPATNIYPS
ncbi:polysaccharide lyase [Mycobacterium sp. SMC-4]|uniref:polysaccharide lyase n=1 Tax=Mycobacterium sp. SMC-4 TaxID=2857059 RepID=UPI0021B2C5FD|nr:polysaccharide lyase [Mycobacterium sp. SMC-4]UXA19563.1 polysaccharide lyase [Mycobacterium sp. SMC-4]